MKKIFSFFLTLFLLSACSQQHASVAPSKTDIFTEGKSGEVIKFTCWIGSSVTVPEI